MIQLVHSLKALTFEEKVKIKLEGKMLHLLKY